MRRRITATLAVALLSIAACGDDDVDTGSPTTTGDRSDASVTSPRGEGSEPPGGIVGPDGAELVEPDPSAIDVRPLSFEPAEAQPEGSAVLIPFWGGVAPCFVLADHDVLETADTVTVTLFAGRAPGSDDVACIEIAKRYAVSVRLDAPLGDRTLVAGSR